MTDIVERLRRWAISTDAVPASDLMDEAADEIERLRSRPCPYVTGTVTQYCRRTRQRCLLHRLVLHLTLWCFRSHQ